MRNLKVTAGTELERKKNCWSVYAKSAEASRETLRTALQSSLGSEGEPGLTVLKCIFRFCYLCLDLSESEASLLCEMKTTCWKGRRKGKGKLVERTELFL